MSTRTRIPTSIAAALLALAALLACNGDKKPEPSPTPGGGGEFVPGQTGEPVKPATDATFRGPAVGLLKSDEVAGYSLTQGPDYYVKDKLYELMDGASDGYIAYGFVELAKGVYKASADKKLAEELTIEVFQFEDRLGALGKFAEERSNCQKMDAHPTNFCLRSSDLLFWKGPYMIKVQTFDDTPEAETAIVELAAAVDKKIEGDATLPPLHARLPADGRLKGSEGYLIRDSFGFAGLKGLHTALYAQAEGAEDEAATLFVVDRGTPEAARKELEDIKALLSADDGVKAKGGLQPLTGLGDDGFLYDDAVGAHTFVVKGGLFAGGREFKDKETATRLTTLLVGGL